MKNNLETSNIEVMQRRAGNGAPHRLRAFTLIELLTVMAIMAIVGAMVLGLTGIAGKKRHEAYAKAVVFRLSAVIDNYYAKMGFYPPDNANNSMLAPGDSNYYTYSAMNPLLYELVGATTNSGNLTVAWSNFPAPYSICQPTLAAYQTTYGRGGVANGVVNADPAGPTVFYKPMPKPTDYSTYPTITNLQGLSVPMTGAPFDYGGGTFNFVHYDSSSTNRHNVNSYDVWVVYNDGNDSSGHPLYRTNGNWNQ